MTQFEIWVGEDVNRYFAVKKEICWNTENLL